MSTKPRKTIDVASLKTRVNRALNDAADHQDKSLGASAKEYREGLAAVLEDVLHASGNYKGFRYTDPLAQHDEQGYLVDGTYDVTRRHYY
jgi:hypothetical protein